VNAALAMVRSKRVTTSCRGYRFRISNRQVPNKFQIQYQISTAETHFINQYRE
jgi:hypothetical protein